MASGGKYSRSIQSASEPYIEFLCGPCSQQDRHVEALNCCIDCGENFCTNCLRDHNKFDKLRGHTIVDKPCHVSGGQAAPTQPTTEKCKVHHDKPVDMFCGNHDVVCCTVCIALNHRACIDVDFLPSAAMGIENSNEVKEISDAMMEVEDELKQVKKMREQDLDRIGKEKDEVLSKIKEIRKEINTHLDDIENKAITKLQEKYKAYTTNISYDIVELDKLIKTLDVYIKQIEKYSGDNESQLFLHVKQGKVSKSNGQKLIHEVSESVEGENIAFTVDKVVRDFSQTVTSFGYFTDESLFNCVDYHGEFDVAVKGDKDTCDITSLCLLNDDTLIIVDCVNEKLKRLDASYKVTETCHVSGHPYAICSTGPAELACSLKDKQMIQFVSVKSRMKLEGSFTVGVKCRGIAYSNGELIVSCGGYRNEGPGQIRMYRFGTLQRTIQFDKVGQNIFSCPRHIAVSAHGKQLYIADWQNGLIIFQRYKVPVEYSIASPNGLKNATGVSVGDGGAVYCCGNNSHNVLKISKQNTSLDFRFLTKPNIWKPWSLCYDKTNCRLIVSTEHANKLKVFKLLASETTVSTGTAV